MRHLFAVRPLVMTAVGGVIVVVSACSDVASPVENVPSPGTVHELYSSSGGGSGSGTSFSTPLPIPAVLSPTSTDATTDYYTVHAKPGTAQLRSGSATPIWGFNGVWPGPTLRAEVNRTVQVQMFNELTDNITIHNHGHFVAASSDGHPVDYIAPGGSKTYTYPNQQRAGTYWYHDHTMDLTGAHVYNGLAAFYLIHDVAEDSLNLPSGSYDVPIVLQDRKLNSDNTLNYTIDSSAIRQGFMGDTMVVNGAVTPHFNVATHKYRLRVLNGSNARSYTLALSNGASFQVISSDGGLLATPVTLTSLAIAPAERYDIVIDFSGFALGTNVTLNNSDSGYPSLPTIMQFVVASSVGDSSTVPSTLSSITRLTTSQATVTRNWKFSQGNGDWTINDLLYDPARIDATPQHGTTEHWVLNNQSGEMHPFHMHLVQFTVVAVNGQTPTPEQMGWKDTVPVPRWGTVDVVMNFPSNSFLGTYVFHCHKLEHEDHRMMLQMQVH